MEIRKWRKHRFYKRKMNIKSPLNYTGNKYRILPQIIPHFPQNIDTMVDLFCGGATVGLNTPCKHIKFIDCNPYVVGLLEYLSSCRFENLLSQLEQLIHHYGLSYSASESYAFYYVQQESTVNRNNGLKAYNQHGYNQLRADYNALADKGTERANQLLYLLIVYGFNNDIRFSNKNQFNLPAGKTDLNKNNIQKLKEYIERVQNMDAEFICGDFRQPNIHDIILQADFVYMDPPYLITDATYNESGRWGIIAEQELLDLVGELLVQHTYFGLSNVISKGEKINLPLSEWLRAHMADVQIINIDYHYRGAYYNKIERSGEREILIIPRYNAEN